MDLDSKGTRSVLEGCFGVYGFWGPGPRVLFGFLNLKDCTRDPQRFLRIESQTLRPKTHTPS